MFLDFDLRAKSNEKSLHHKYATLCNDLKYHAEIPFEVGYHLISPFSYIRHSFTCKNVL